MTCGLEGQKHMAVDNFLSLRCQSAVTPHLHSLWWCQPIAVANCQGGIRYAGQVAKRESGTLAWHRNKKHANCFPICCRAWLSGPLNHRVERRFLFLSLGLSHTRAVSLSFSRQSLHRIHLSLLSLMESGFSSLSSMSRFFLSLPISSLAISIAALSELDSHWMTQSDRAVSNHEVLHGMIW